MFVIKSQGRNEMRYIKFLLIMSYFFFTGHFASAAEISLDRNPVGVAINPDTDMAVVANEKSDTVSIVDINTQSVLATVTVGKGPKAVAIDRELNIALIGNIDDDTITVIDLAAYEVQSTISVGKQPEGIAIFAISQVALVANHKDNSVTVIDLGTFGLVNSIAVGQEPIDVAVDPELKAALAVSEKDWNVSVIDLESFEVTETIPVGKKPHAIDIDPESHLAVITNEKDNTISVINLLDLTEKNIAAGKHPLDVDINPLDGRVLVVSDEDRSMLLIDPGTGGIVKNYGLNKLPRGVAVNPYTNIAAIVNDKTDELTLIQLPNPAPHIDSMEPGTLLRGSSSVKVAIEGLRFLKTSVVSIKSDTAMYDLRPVFIDNYRLEMEIPGEMLKTTGDYTLTVMNPAPEGGTSNGVGIKVENPVPQIATLEPDEAAAGTAGLTLNIHGAGVFEDTDFRINGIRRAASYLSYRKATLDLAASDVEYGRYLDITAFNPPPGGGTSASAVFTVLNPVPSLLSISPSTVMAGSPSFIMTLSGDNFVTTSRVSLNGLELESNYTNKSEIKAEIPSSAVGVQGAYPVKVINPLPGGGESEALTLTVKPAITVEVEITSPGDGEVIDRANVMAKGTVKSDSADVGVTVNGMLADVIGDEWVINDVPLTVGANLINAVATDSAGNKAAASITVQTNEIAEGVKLSADLTSGTAPLTVNFTLSGGTFAPLFYDLDFEGGWNYYYSDTVFENVSHTYTEVGIYYPTIYAWDYEGNVDIDTIAIAVLPRAGVDALLKGKWEGMKQALAEGDIEGGLSNFAEGSRDRYRTTFQLLFDKISLLASNMQNIEMVYVKGPIAKYRIRREQQFSFGQPVEPPPGREGDPRRAPVIEEPPETVITYYIYFGRTADGLWKIEQF